MLSAEAGSSTGGGSFLYDLGIGSVFYGFDTFFNPMVDELEMLS